MSSQTVSATPGPAAARPRWYAHPYNRAAYYRLAGFVAWHLPRPARVRLAARTARLLASRFAAERSAVRRNLARLHPTRETAWLDAAVSRVFANFAVCFADLLSLDRGPGTELWRHVAGVDEQAPTREALARGRGCVSITAHLGNWELAGRLLVRLGRRVHVVMAPEVDPEVGAALDRRMGGSAGQVRVVRLDGPVVAVGLIAALRRGEVVAFQMDRAIGGRSDCLVPFCGTPAPFPIGPFVVAAAAGAPVVPAFCVLDERRGYRLLVEPAFDVTRGEEAQGLRCAVAILERHVTAHADQWFNFFDVWAHG